MTKDQLLDELKRLRRRISELEKPKKEHDQVEKRLRIMDYAVASSINAAGITDLDGKLIYVNDSCVKMWGFNHENEMLGRSLLEFWEGEGIQETIKVLMEKGWRIGEDIGKRKDGSLCEAQFSASIIKNDEGNPIYMFGSFFDISERKKAEKALHESEEKYRAIFESFFDVYFRTDREGIVTLISPSVQTQAGWEPEEVIGNPVTDFYRDPQERDVFNEKLKEKGLINDYELQLLAKNGRVIDVSMSAKIVLGIDGSSIGVDGVLRDITDRKEAEAQVKASLQEKEVLLQEIHHRVKNNMQIISSLLNLQSLQIEDQSVKDMFQMSQDRIRSMALIHEKLYQSKDLASINFAQYIRSLTVHLMHTYNAKVKHVHLKTQVDNVFLDISKAIPCGLIINELVSNSLKHAFPGEKQGEILVKLHSNNNGKVMLEVSDTGVGFPDDLNFRRPDSLGLQLVNDLANQLGGILEFDRTKGTAVKIAFNRSANAN